MQGQCLAHLDRPTATLKLSLSGSNLRLGIDLGGSKDRDLPLPMDQELLRRQVLTLKVTMRNPSQQSC